MQQITIKPKQIPTALNFAYHQQKQLNRLRHQNRLQQFLINCLIIAQLITMVYMITDNMQQNRAMSYPPLETLSIEELEVIGD